MKRNPLQSALLFAIVFASSPSFALSIAPPLDLDFTPLHQAAAQCNVSEARSLISGSTSLDHQDRMDATPLMLAAEAGCLDIVMLLVEHGAAIDFAKGTGSRTALLHAAENGHADVVAYLLDKGADVTARTRLGDVPLTLALRGTLFQKGPQPDRQGVVEALLRHGAAVNVAGEFGRTPLMWAVRNLDAATAWALLQKGADPAVKDEKGLTAISMAESQGLDYLAQLLKNPKLPDLAINGRKTPLTEAIKSGNAATVAELLRQGADVNGRFGNGETPLMQAASMGRVDLVELLVKAGAAVNLTNGANFSALMHATNGGHTKAVEALLAKGADVKLASVGRTALAFAVMANNTDAARLLLDKGSDPNIRIDGSTLLAMALNEGFGEMAGLIIAKGAHVDAGDEKGRTPLLIACDKGNLAAVTWLLAKGADVNRQSTEGETALTIAIAGKKDDIVPLLLAKGATVRGEDLDGAVKSGNVQLAALMIERGAPVKNALLDAVPRGSLEMVKMLLAKGADLEARDYYGKTPLLREVDAWSDANPAVVAYLLEHGAKIDAQDDKGMTALHTSASQGTLTIARVLLAKGANSGLKNAGGKTPWLLAAERNDADMMQLLERAGAAREYAGMSWEGHDAKQKEPYIKVVDDRAEWENLWRRAFDKPAPAVDLENFAIACVFLGEHADWLYSIRFDKPQQQGVVMAIRYHLFMVEARINPYSRGPRFGGQYRMEVVPKAKGIRMQMEQAKDKKDRFTDIPPGDLQELEEFARGVKGKGNVPPEETDK